MVICVDPLSDAFVGYRWGVLRAVEVKGKHGCFR